MANGYLIFKPNAKGIWSTKVVMGPSIGRPLDDFKYEEIPYSQDEGFLIESHKNLGVRVLFYDKNRFAMRDKAGKRICAIAAVTGFFNQNLTPVNPYQYETVPFVIELNIIDHAQIISKWNELMYKMYHPQPIAHQSMSLAEWQFQAQLSATNYQDLGSNQAQIAQYQDYLAQRQQEQDATLALSKIKQRLEDEQNLEIISKLNITSSTLQQANDSTEEEEEEDQIAEIKTTPSPIQNNQALFFSVKENKATLEQKLIEQFHQILKEPPSEATKQIYDLIEKNKKAFKERNQSLFNKLLDTDFSIQICISLLRANNKIPGKFKLAMLWRLTKFSDEEFSNRGIKDMSKYIGLYTKLTVTGKKDPELKIALKNKNYTLITMSAIEPENLEEEEEEALPKTSAPILAEPKPSTEQSVRSHLEEQRLGLATKAIMSMDANLFNQTLNMGKLDKFLPKVFEIIRMQNVTEDQEELYEEFTLQINLNLQQLCKLFDRKFISPTAENLWNNLAFDKIQEMVRNHDTKVIEILKYSNYEMFLQSNEYNQKTLLMLALENKCVKQKIIDFLIENSGFSILNKDEYDDNVLHYWVNNFANEKFSLDPSAKIFEKIYVKFQEEVKKIIQQRNKGKMNQKELTYLLTQKILKNKYEQSFIHMLLEHENSPKIVTAVFNILLNNGNLLTLLEKNPSGDNAFTLLEEKTPDFSPALNLLGDAIVQSADLLQQYVSKQEHPVHDLFNLNGSSYLNALLDDIENVDDEQYKKAKEIIVRRLKIRSALFKKYEIFNELGNDLVNPVYHVFAQENNKETINKKNNLIKLNIDCELKVPYRTIINNLVAEIQDEADTKIFIQKSKVIFDIYNAFLNELETRTNIEPIINGVYMGINMLSEIIVFATESLKHNFQDGYLKSIELLKRIIKCGIDFNAIKDPTNPNNILHNVLAYYESKLIDIELIRNLIDSIVEFAGIDTLKTLLQNKIADSKTSHIKEIDAPFEIINNKFPEVILEINNLKVAINEIVSNTKFIAKNKM